MLFRSLSSRELVFAQLAQRMASAVDVPVVHGMQEVSGSSPLSSTPLCLRWSEASSTISARMDLAVVLATVRYKRWSARSDECLRVLRMLLAQFRLASSPSHSSGGMWSR